MSDALTDIARDERRAKLCAVYVRAVWIFLQTLEKTSAQRVRKAAEATDAVPIGYWGSRTSLVKQLDAGLLTKLSAGAPEPWKELLRLARDVGAHTEYVGLREKAPFREVKPCPHCHKLLFDGEA